MAVFFAFLTLVGWAVGDIFVTLASRRVGNIPTIFWGQLFSVIITSFYIPFVGIPSDLPMLIFAILLCLSLSWGTVFYFRALEVGNAQLAGTIGGSYVLPTVFLSVVIFGERLSSGQVLGIFLILVGLILSSFELRQLKNKKLNEIFSDKGAKYAFLAMLVWGVFYAVIRVPAEKIGWFWAFYPANFFFIPLLIFGKVKKTALQIFKDGKTFLVIILFAVFILMAQFAYNLGILNGNTSIVAPIAGSYPVLFVVLARIVFKEKLSRQQSLGIVFSLLGIILISLAY